MTRRQILLALLPPLFFGTGFTIAKPAVTHFPPLFMMLMVYAGIAVVLGLTHRDRLKTPVLSIIAIAAFAVTIQGALLFWGLRNEAMPATAANLILQIQIPFAVLLDWLIMRVPLDGRKLLGNTIAVLGVGLVIGLPEQAPGLLPSVMIIVSAFCWALGQVLARKLGKDSGVGLLKANAFGSEGQCVLCLLRRVGVGANSKSSILVRQLHHERVVAVNIAVGGLHGLGDQDLLQFAVRSVD